MAEVFKERLSSDDLDKVYQKVYKKLMLEVDAIDNGVSESDQPLKYRIGSHLGNRVARYNV